MNIYNDIVKMVNLNNINETISLRLLSSLAFLRYLTYQDEEPRRRRRNNNNNNNGGNGTSGYCVGQQNSPLFHCMVPSWTRWGFMRFVQV